MASKKVLYISYDGMTDPLGRSQVLPYLAGLSQQGYSFTLISFEKPERYQKFKSQIEQICAANAIRWVPLMYTKRPPVLSTIYDVIKMRKLAFELQQEHHFDIVHARGAYVTSIVAHALQQKFGVRYVFDMRGFWADERIDGRLWNLKNPIYRTIYNFFKKREKKFLEQADYVITLTHEAEKEIHSWEHIDRSPVPIEVIPCCVDMDTFSTARVDIALRGQLRDSLNLTQDDYILLYLGSLGTWYMLGEMLDFFRVLHSIKPAAKLLFVTNDAQDHIFSEAAARGIDRSLLRVVNSPFDQVPTHIALADASIFFITPAYSKKASSPVKQGELMSMGVPVVCNAGVGDTEWIVKKYGSGVVVDQFDQSGYETAARLLLSTRFDKKAIQEGAEEFFSVQEGVARYREVYEAILTNPSPVHA
ncbi:MAG: glycosyltransferase [Bacteroidetes bacterium]|nr:glycosyltransferase [Bacteroidota bacterium]